MRLDIAIVEERSLRLEPTSASALRASYATKLQKQGSIYLDIADVVRDVEKLDLRKVLRKILRQDALQTTISLFWTFPIPRFWCISRETGLFQHPRLVTTIGFLWERLS